MPAQITRGGRSGGNVPVPSIVRSNARHFERTRERRPNLFAERQVHLSDEPNREMQLFGLHPGDARVWRTLLGAALQALRSSAPPLR